MAVGGRLLSKTMIMPPGNERTGILQRVTWLLLVPLLVGAVTGLLVSGLVWLFEIMSLGSLASSTTPWTVFVLLAALPLSVLCMKYIAGTLSPSTNEFYIIHSNERPVRMPLRQIPGRLLAGGVTVGCGGAQGLESPSSSLGAGLGVLFERLFGRSLADRERGLLMKAGASAGISAIFSSPGVGAMYGLEVPYRRGIDVRPIVQAVIAAAAAYLIRFLTVGANPLVPYADVDISIDGPLVWTTLLVGLACGLGARVFAFAANTARTVRTRLRPWLGAVIGSLSLVILAWIAWRCTDSWVTLGPGHVMFDWTLSESRDAWLLLLILLLHAAATVVCVFGGGGGGVFTSLTATGAMVGCIAAALLGQPDNLFLPLVGGACLLSAAYRIPIAGMMLIIEWGSGLESALLGIVCVVIAQVCMGDSTIAPGQSPSPSKSSGAPSGPPVSPRP